MTKGIREYTNARFAQMLPKFQSKELDGTAFRKSVMEDVVQQFGISIASAATHYNHSLKMQRGVDAASVEGLGRPEEKKGGRKPIHTVTVIKVKTGEVVAEGISRAKADTLIAKAAASRKPKLAIKEPEPVAEQPTEQVTAPAQEAPAEAVS